MSENGNTGAVCRECALAAGGRDVSLSRRDTISADAGTAACAADNNKERETDNE